MKVEQIKQKAIGNWKSITPELRPMKYPDGSTQPFYLSREFTFHEDMTWTMIGITYADPYGEIPLNRLDAAGFTDWVGEHPIADGAQKVDFTAEYAFKVTPLAQVFADLLNEITVGFNEWKVGEGQETLKKAFPPFGLAEGDVFKEYDLVYIYNDMMFWGARNLDGTGFYPEENRPTNLQIPLVRK